jgi:endonuclease/exonuclease/phosphatase family metal-dependent hydrolase
MGHASVLMLGGALRLLGFFTDPRLSDRDIHAVVGEPLRISAPAISVDAGASAPPAEGGHQLTIVTWNIEQGMAYGAILETLRTLDADILLLQEVDRYCRRTGYRDVARDLADALDMNWVAAGEFQEIGEGRRGRAAVTGQAILSRFPIEDARVIRFKAQDRWRWSINPVQPRRGGRMALVARSRGLLLYNTHIESGGNDKLQRKQMAELLADQARNAGPAVTATAPQVTGAPAITAALPAVTAALPASAVLIAGDFNNGPIMHCPMLAHLSAASFTDALGASADRAPTSRGQHHPIDWIFVKGVTPVRGQGRVVDGHAASDHSPVVAALNTGVAVALSR